MCISAADVLLQQYVYRSNVRTCTPVPRQIHGLSASHVAQPTAPARSRPPPTRRAVPAVHADASVLMHAQRNSRRSIATIVVTFFGSPFARVRGTATTHAKPADRTKSCSPHCSQNPILKLDWMEWVRRMWAAMTYVPPEEAEMKAIAEAAKERGGRCWVEMKGGFDNYTPEEVEAIRRIMPVLATGFGQLKMASVDEHGMFHVQMDITNNV